MKIELKRVHVVGEDTGFTSSSKRPTTGDPTLSPTAGISPPGVGLGAASWKREMALMVVFGSVAHLVIKICGSNRLPWTVQSGSATATDLDPHQLRLHSLLHWWAPLYLCILWQTPPVGESGKRELRLTNLLFRERNPLLSTHPFHHIETGTVLFAWHRPIRQRSNWDLKQEIQQVFKWN